MWFLTGSILRYRQKRGFVWSLFFCAFRQRLFCIFVVQIMKEKFLQELGKLVPQMDTRRYLLAVSGGADSSVLAYLFHTCNLSYAIAHCNFHLRAEESDMDMMLVRKMADEYGVSYYEKEFDTLNVQKTSNDSIEMVARQLRYSWFEELSSDFDYVVTAHHANDNAETQLLNLCRGTGLKGLTAIPPQNGKILRPLLHFTADEIRTFARQNEIAYRNDASNFTELYARNKVRLSVIPKLEEINPAVIPTFARNISLLQNQYAFYRHQMDDVKKCLLKKDENQWYINIEKWDKFQDKELILHEILRDFDFNSSTITEILDGIGGLSGKQYLSSSHIITKDRKKLLIASIQPEDNSSLFIYDMQDLKQYGFDVEWVKASRPENFDGNNNVLYVDVDKLKFPLCLRHWLPADKFRPLGMNGMQKLSDFFINHKVDRLTKNRILLLLSEDKIVWIVGYRSDDRFKIDSKTENFYKIKYNGRK